MRMAFRVSLDVPRGIDREDVHAYILDAVSGWKGAFNPGTIENHFEDADPLCEIKNVVVK